MKPLQSLRTSFAITFLTLFLAAPTLVDAQLTRGTISGTITDQSNALIAETRVVIRNLATGIERETTSNDVGVYRFVAVEPGTYSVEFVKQGFQSQKLPSLIVGVAQEIVINRTMEVGAVATELSISTTGIELAKTTPTISSTFNERVVQDLPITAAARDVTRLIVLAPTAVRATGSNEISANGQRARNNNFILDGTDNNDLSVTLDSARIIPEAIAELQVQVAAYSAEFGRNTGAQALAVTRSGANQFHGEVWEYYRGNWMEPLALENKRVPLKETPRFVHNQAGGSASGPIFKDRTFFFGLFEINRRREAGDARNATSTIIPTPAGYSTLQNVPLGSGQTTQSRQAVLQALAFLPEIHGQVQNYENANSNQLVNGVPIEVGTILIPLANPYDYWYSVGRVDHRLTSKDSLNYRFVLDHQVETDVASNLRFGPKWTADQNIFRQNHAISYTRTFSPSLINEFRVAYIRGNLDFPERDTESSTVTITGLTTLGGLSNYPQGRITNTFQFQDVATYVTGRHALKFGVDIRRNQLYNISAFDSKGTWVFSNLQDFMNNTALSLTQAVNEATFDAYQTNQYYFFQDDFKATRDLTFNFGIRYEYSTVPLGYFGAATDEIAAAGVPRPPRPDKNNWAPRFGFAYSPSLGGFGGKIFGDGRSVIRGGFGVGYDVLFYNILTVSASNYPRVVQSVTNQPDTNNLFPTLAPKVPVLPPFDPLLQFVNVPETLQNPTTHFWSLSIQRQLGSNYALEVGYSGNRSYHQLRQGQGNPPTLTQQQADTVLSTRSTTSIPSVQNRRLNPAWGSRVLIESAAKGEYHAGYIKFDKRLSRGLLIGANYTFSNNFSDNDESLAVTNLADSSPQIPQAFYNYDMRREWSRSAFDRPHRFAIHYIYEIPWFSSGFADSSVMRTIFKGWQLSGFTEFQSGQPFTIRTGADSTGIGSTTPARPDVNPGGIVKRDPVTDDFRTFSIPIDGSGIVTTPLGNNSLPLANTMPNGGTLGRNTYRGPSYQNWNVSLMKIFPITERVRFQFRTDFINAWNHNNFRNPENRMTSTDFGRNVASLATDSRFMLLSAKLKF